jgi:chlorite dismutase
MPNPISVVFAASATGSWRVERIVTLCGEPLPHAAALDRLEGILEPRTRPGMVWSLRGVTSNERYVNRPEKEALVAIQPGLGRSESTHAALIPIKKSEAWWSLAQDERRAILEERSKHIATGLGFLPAVARRLYHARDLGEPFDFLTWFEFAPEDRPFFDELLSLLRETEEWTFVEREVEVRLEKSEPESHS